MLSSAGYAPLGSAAPLRGEPRGAHALPGRAAAPPAAPQPPGLPGPPGVSRAPDASMVPLPRFGQKRNVMS